MLLVSGQMGKHASAPLAPGPRQPLPLTRAWLACPPAHLQVNYVHGHQSERQAAHEAGQEGEADGDGDEAVGRGVGGGGGCGGG